MKPTNKTAGAIVSPPLSQPRDLLEKGARANGFKIIAGGDEAGRGPWAGPVFAAMVILPEKYHLPGLDDSKKLTRDQRRDLFIRIRNLAVAYGIGRAEPEEIDAINILEATRLAFRRAFEALPLPPDYLLLDFITLPWLKLPFLAIPKGESHSDSIAAASILAKESRDLIMEEMEGTYPGYGFGKHMGYGTPQHQKALAHLGVCPIHRRTFKPVKKVIEEMSAPMSTLQKNEISPT